MEDPPGPPRPVLEALANLNSVARESGFFEPFVTLLREDGGPPAYHTHLQAGSALHAGVTSWLLAASWCPSSSCRSPKCELMEAVLGKTLFLFGKCLKNVKKLHNWFKSCSNITKCNGLILHIVGVERQACCDVL